MGEYVEKHWSRRESLRVLLFLEVGEEGLMVFLVIISTFISVSVSCSLKIVSLQVNSN